MLPMRGYVFIGLNAVRALSIISLLLVFASSIFVLVTDVQAVNRFMKDGTDQDLSDCDYIESSTVPNQPAGVFWAVVNRLLIITQVIFLILSELGLFSSFFTRFFPVLGPHFGLGPLGIFQCLIGATILSHHVDDFTLVAAFLLFSIGCLNMLLGLIFREGAKTKRSPWAWKEHAKGVLPTSVKVPGLGAKVDISSRPAFTRPQSGFVSAFFAGKGARQPNEEVAHEKAGFGFGTAGEKKAQFKGFLLRTPSQTLPRYASPPRSYANESSRAGTPEPRFKSSDTAI